MRLENKPYFFPEKPVHLLQRRTSRRNAHLILNISFILVALIILYSGLFHFFMNLEDRSYSWLTGLYWTLTQLSTLGLGDITFKSDAGKLFTIVVISTGLLYLLVIIPFAFIRLFQSASRAPHELSMSVKNHIVLTNNGVITSSLIKKLQHYAKPYVLIVKELTEALDLIDQGLKVVHGDLDDPATYKNVNINQAALVAATASDTENTSITYAVRSISDHVPIIATAYSKGSAEVLRIAGCNRVLSLDEIMGEALARRILGGDALAHKIGHIDDIYIAEALTKGTPLVGRTLREIKLPELIGATVVGMWKQGTFEMVYPDSVISDQTVLVLAGSSEQIRHYNEMFCIYNAVSSPSLIIGAGSVGVTMAKELQKRDVEFVVLDKSKANLLQGKNFVLGDAKDTNILKINGIKEAPSVAITTHSDSTNLYLTTLCRNLNPETQIISCATKERYIQLLHQAGCDFVMSYASIGANSIFNFQKSGNILMVDEGVDVFKVQLPQSLLGKRIHETNIRSECGCSIIGLSRDNNVEINPASEKMLDNGYELLLIGTVESEVRFLKKYNN